MSHMQRGRCLGLAFDIGGAWSRAKEQARLGFPSLPKFSKLVWIFQACRGVSSTTQMAPQRMVDALYEAIGCTSTTSFWQDQVQMWQQCLLVGWSRTSVSWTPIWRPSLLFPGAPRGGEKGELPSYNLPCGFPGAPGWKEGIITSNTNR